jgi:S-(hydroxymethyl)glutathione dehydrogenase/alcohol dehydrogenase
MRGVVFDGEKVVVATDLEVREPGPGEVRVRIQAAGVCHSDLAVIDGKIPWPTPCVLGHEGAGVVDALGEGVGHLAVGDPVVLSTIRNCGHCDACDRGRPTHCRATFGQLFQPFRRDDQSVYSFAATSVFAEQTVVSAVQAVKIPAGLPPTSTALVGCGVLTGVGAVLNRAKVAQGNSVVVIGIGGIGLNAVQGARLAGALPIIAIDTNPAKEEVARAFGATHFIDASKVDALEAVKALRPNGVDFAFECVGSPALVRLCTDLLDWGGSAVVIGVPAPGSEAKFEIGAMYHDKSIMMCRYGGSHPQHDIPLYTNLYREGRLLLDELVTETYELEDVESAIQDLRDGKLARGVLRIQA